VRNKQINTSEEFPGLADRESDQTEDRRDEPEPLRERMRKVAAQRTRDWQMIKLCNNVQTEKGELLVLEGLSAREGFYYFFSDREYFESSSPQPFHSFFECMLFSFGDTSARFEPMAPAAPRFFTDLKSNDLASLLSAPLYSQRDLVLLHPIVSKIPFMPKDCEANINEKIFFLSENSVVVEKISITKNVPLSDCFQQFNAYMLSEDKAGNCVISFEYYINILK